DHGEMVDARIPQGRDRGVAETEPAHEHRESVTSRGGEAEGREFLLGGGEQARHEELVAELDFEDVDAGHRIPSSSERELAHRGGLPVESLESQTHPPRSFAPTSDAYAGMSTRRPYRRDTIRNGRPSPSSSSRKAPSSARARGAPRHRWRPAPNHNCRWC